MEIEVKRYQQQISEDMFIHAVGRVQEEEELRATARVPKLITGSCNLRRAILQKANISRLKKSGACTGRAVPLQGREPKI